MPENNLLFVTAAYALTWIVVLGYAWHLHRTLAASKHALERAAALAGETDQ